MILLQPMLLPALLLLPVLALPLLLLRQLQTEHQIINIIITVHNSPVIFKCSSVKFKSGERRERGKLDHRRRGRSL
jgi:hypothetical protein